MRTTHTDDRAGCGGSDRGGSSEARPALMPCIHLWALPLLSTRVTPGRGPGQFQVLTCSSITTPSPTYPTHRHLDGDRRPLPTPNAPHATTGRSASPPALPEPPCPGRPALITYTRRSARLAPLLALWPAPMRPFDCAPAPVADSPWPDRSRDLPHAEDRAVPPRRSRPDLGRPGGPALLARNLRRRRGGWCCGLCPVTRFDAIRDDSTRDPDEQLPLTC